MVQALHPSLCHPQTFCLTSPLCNPLTHTLCFQSFSSRLSLHSHTQPLSSCSHSLATTHPPTLSEILSSPLVFMQTPPLRTLSCTTSPLAPTHRHPPSPEHMQSRGISFYCPYSPCSPTHLPFIHCNNTFRVEVVLLRAATQTTQESQVFAQNCSYL